jgi:hypothetical protein
MWESYHTKELKEKYLFKFLSKKYLYEFLKIEQIWFSRADKFGDKMECVSIAHLLKPKPNYTEINARKRKFLISCWHIANKESLAFWDTYSKRPEDRRIIAIRFKRKILIEYFKERFYNNNSFYIKTKWVHGKVEYQDLANSSKENLINFRMLYPAFRKDSAFRYENEYRFVIEFINEDYFSSDGFGYNLGLSNELDYDIIINPLLDKVEYNEIHLELKKEEFENKIQKSALYNWLKPEEW